MQPAQKLFLLLMTSSLLGFAAAPQPIQQCLEEARSWIYRNTSAGSSEAAKAAMDFCSKGGRSTCLDGAKSFIYHNTSASSSEASTRAVKFCARGDETCLQPTKDWIYRNTSASSSDASEQALQTCSQRFICEPENTFKVKK